MSRSNNMRKEKLIWKIMSTVGVLAVVMVIVGTTSIPTMAKTKPHLSKKSIVMSKGASYDLRINGDFGFNLIGDYAIRWKSSNNKVVSVSGDIDNATLKAKRKGSAVVSVVVEKKKLKCKVMVEDPKLSANNITVEKGVPYTLKVKGTTQKIKWGVKLDPIYDPILSISQNGVINATDTGKTEVYAYVGGAKRTCKVTVVDRKVDDSTLEKTIFENSKGIVILVKNNNDFSIDLKARATFSDANGVINTDSNERDYDEYDGEGCKIEAGQTGAVELDCSTDLGKYTSYTIDVSAVGSVSSTNYAKGITYSIDKNTLIVQKGLSSDCRSVRVCELDYDANGQFKGMMNHTICFEDGVSRAKENLGIGLDDKTGCSYKVFITSGEN